MNLSQFKPFKQYSFYDDSIYNQIFENVTPSQNETLLYMQILWSLCVQKYWTQYNTDYPGMLSSAIYGCHFLLVFITEANLQTIAMRA